MLDTHARKYFDRLFQVIAHRFLRWHLRPVHITAAALILGLGSGVLLYFDLSGVAVGVLWVSGLLDAVDGEMARRSGTSSLFGAQMDIICDRLVELSLVWALALQHLDCLLPLLGLVSAILVSMTVFLTTGMLVKTKGKKSFYYQAGLMERTEGFIAFSVMILAQHNLAIWTWIYTALILITVIQRLLESFRILRYPEYSGEEKDFSGKERGL